MDFNWENKQDDVDYILAEDVNNLAEGVIEGITKAEEAKEVADSAIDYTDIFADEFRGKIGTPTAQGEGNGGNFVGGFSKIILPSYGRNNSFYIQVDASSEMHIVFTVPNETLIFDVKNKDSGTVIVLNEETSEQTTRVDEQGILEIMEECTIIGSDDGCIFYYYTDCGSAIDNARDYTDNAIQQAIIDSWEDAV